jgi:hypothetical protein
MVLVQAVFQDVLPTELVYGAEKMNVCHHCM